MDTDMGCGPPATSTTLITTLHTPTTQARKKLTGRLSTHYLPTIYLGGGDRVVPVRGGVHALPHLLHPARLPGQGRGRQNIT